MDLKAQKGDSFIRLYLRYKYFVIISILICVFLGFNYIQIVKPLYRINAEAVLISTRPLTTQEMNKIVLHIKSKRFLVKALEELSLIGQEQLYQQNLVIATSDVNKIHFTFSVLDSNIENSKGLINKLIKNFNQEDTADPKNIGITALKDSLVLANGQLAALQTKFGLITKQRQFTRRQVTTKSLDPSVLLQLNLLNVVSGYLKYPVNQFLLIPYADEIKDTTLRSLVSDFNLSQSKKQAQLNELKVGSPVVKQLDQHIWALQEALIRKIAKKRTEINGVQIIVPVAPKPDSGAVVDHLIHLKSNLVDSLNKKRLFYERETSQRVQLLASGIPESDDKPEYPKKGFVYLFSVLIGLTFPGLTIYFYPGLNGLAINKIHALKKIKKYASVPIYTIFGSENFSDPSKFNKDIHKALSIHNDPGKVCQTFLISSVFKDDIQIILLKFLSVNLASIGGKTVIIDLNFSAPSLLKSFGLSNEIGVVDFLNKEETEINLLLQPSGIENLQLIGTGVVFNVVNPVTAYFNNNQLTSPWSDENNMEDLINHSRLKVLIKELKKGFDFVLLNSPPMNLPAELFPLVKFSDLQIIVTKTNSLNPIQMKKINNFASKKRFVNPMIFYLADVF